MPNPSGRALHFEIESARVKVVTGATLAELDTTGTLTQKYQARGIRGVVATELISSHDTELLGRFTRKNVELGQVATPVSVPTFGELLPISEIYSRLSPLVGVTFRDAGSDQERNRGASLHRLICRALGYSSYQDDGQFPDVRHQLLEVKLQTSPTIDLGLVQPSSEALLDVPQIANEQLRHCDVRYAIFFATTNGHHVILTNFVLVTGEQFFARFPQFQGKVLNKKIQIPLPGDFFVG